MFILWGHFAFVGTVCIYIMGTLCVCWDIVRSAWMCCVALGNSFRGFAEPCENTKAAVISGGQRRHLEDRNDSIVSLSL